MFDNIVIVMALWSDGIRTISKFIKMHTLNVIFVYKYVSICLS